MFPEFRSGRAPILVATDVASRGLGKYLAVNDVCQQYDNYLLQDCSSLRNSHRNRIERFYMFCILTL